MIGIGRGVLLFVLITLLCVDAASKQWKSNQNGDWTNPDNWIPSGIPTQTDDVEITNDGNYQVILSTQASVNTLTLGGSGRQALVLQGAVLTFVNGGTVLPAGVLDVSSATLEGQGSLVVKGLASFHDSSTKIISNMDLTIQGMMTLDIGGVKLDSGATLTVAEGGVLNITSKEGVLNTDLTDAALVNFGTINVIAGLRADYQTTISSRVQNVGVINVQMGTLQLYNGGTYSGTLNIYDQARANALAGNHTFASGSLIAGNGTVLVSNLAVVILNGNVQVASFQLNGGGAYVIADNLNGVSFKQLTVTNGNLLGLSANVDTLIWEGGSFHINGLTVTNLQVFTSIARYIVTTQLVITGNASFLNDTNIYLRSGSSVTVNPGATMWLDRHVFFLCTNDTVSNIQIAGNLTIQNDNVTQFTCSVVIQPSGFVEVKSGVLQVQAPFETYGTLLISSISSVDLWQGGPVHASASLLGPGTIRCTSCSLIIWGKVDLGTFIFPAGSLTFQLDKGSTPYLPHIRSFQQSGSSVLSLLNTAQPYTALNLTIDQLSITGGSIITNQDLSLGLQVHIIAIGTATFGGNSPIILTNVVYVNEENAVTNIASTGPIELQQNARIYNNGIWIVTGKMSVSQTDHDAGYVSRFVNRATFSVFSVGSATLALTFDNFGTVTVDPAGSLTVSGFYYQTVGVATTSVQGGIFSSSNPIYILKGTLEGYGVVQANVFSQGVISPTNGSVPLTISGNLQQTAPGYLYIPVDVSGNNTFVLDGTLSVTGTFQLYGGRLVFSSLAGIVVPDTVPALTFAKYGSLSGSGFDSISSANINEKQGFNVVVGASSISFTGAAVPVVTSVSPSHGPASGGTLVTISGTNFAPGAHIQVSIGNNIGTFVGYSNDNFVAYTPPGAGLKQNVCVIIDGRGCFGTAQQGSFDYDAPVITSVSPNHGPTKGGYVLTILGSNFGPNASVIVAKVGSAVCSNVQFIPGGFACVVPEGVGCPQVVVIANGQSSAPAPTCFAFDAPVVDGISPASVSTRGGEVLLIHGYNFGGQNISDLPVVTIGGSPCKNVTVLGPNYISCITPSLPSSKVTIEVAFGTQKSNSTVSFTPSAASGSSGTKEPHPWWIWLVLGIGIVVFFVGGFVGGFFFYKKRSAGYALVTN